MDGSATFRIVRSRLTSRMLMQQIARTSALCSIVAVGGESLTAIARLARNRSCSLDVSRLTCFDASCGRAAPVGQDVLEELGALAETAVPGTRDHLQRRILR